ncbi:cytochrome P450 [Gloeopeniophorella convolvens]|nr:cytochrome P450 [Gloeopeniophorella convolvens]
MNNLTRFDLLIAVVMFSTTLVLFTLRVRRRRLPYPPGPKRLPVIGNLLDMPSREEWVVFKKWSDTYGSDVVHADVMGTHTIILNSMKAAKELLERRSSIYSDRPPFVALLELFCMRWDIAALPYGKEWRRLRHEFHVNFHPAAVKDYEPVELRAVHRFLRSLLVHPDKFPQHLRHMTGQIIMEIAYGFDILPENDPYVVSAERVIRTIALSTTKEAYLFDAVPWLKHMPSWFPGARLKREADKWRPLVISSIEQPWNEVKAALSTGSAAPSVAAAMISKLDDDSTPEDTWAAKAVPGMMYMSAVDTTVSALLTFMIAMLKHPEVQCKAQREIDEVIGTSRLPDFSDQDALPYVSAVLKETLRWHPVTPLATPHRVVQNDTYDGHFIPAGSVVIGNVWGILHDPVAFPEPERFIPERWLAPGAPAFPEIAFGFGRRECPGRFMARATIWATIVEMLAAFEMAPVENGLLEEEYSSGVVSYVKPFKCHIRPRSEVAAELVRGTLNEIIE